MTAIEFELSDRRRAASQQGGSGGGQAEVARLQSQRERLMNKLYRATGRAKVRGLGVRSSR
jgi:hypothetical protein